MRILLIPLLLALAVVLAAIVLAAPPKAAESVGPIAQSQEQKN
jgi:hypothetical protein